MSRSSALILLGALAVITPFSGLPSSFRTFLTVVVGALVFAFGLRERARIARESRAALERPPVQESSAPAPSHGVSPI